MYSATAVIRNRTGLHMRPAADFIRCAAGFQSKITLVRCDDGRKGSAKSALALLQMELSQGTQIRLEAEGPDERDAVEGLLTLLNRFGEE